MALIDSGPLQGFYRPDYHGASLVDLMASVIRARGGQSAHTGLGAEFEQQLAGARHVVLLVIDGLGLAQREDYLTTNAGSTFLAQRPERELSSVFPATTAAAVTTLMTGASPAEHGILGWFLNLHDLGVVSAILPAISRTDMPIVDGTFPLADYLAIPRPIETMAGLRIALTHRFILESRYSNAAAGWSETHAVENLGALEEALTRLVQRPDPTYFYGYWPGFDALSHEFGPDSEQALRHLDEIDALLGRLQDALRPHGAALLVTADHGFVATPPEQHVDLSAIDGLYDDLATLPSGDSRSVSLFARPARLAVLHDRLRDFGDRFATVEGAALFEAGVFGPGDHHPALYGRVGDLVLLARGACSLSAPPYGRPPHRVPGSHGGMTEPEMRIPLFYAGP